MQVSGKLNSYQADDSVTISRNKTFSFDDCICVFWTSEPDENRVFIRRYVNVQYFNKINQEIFRDLEFVLKPSIHPIRGLDIIKTTEEKSKAIIKDIKESEYYR